MNPSRKCWDIWSFNGLEVELQRTHCAVLLYHGNYCCDAILNLL